MKILNLYAGIGGNRKFWSNAKVTAVKVLIACETSGIVREAFNAYHGVRAISCDLLPAEDGRVDYHYQGDVRDILNNGWDLMIAHPPCTRLSNSGVRWLAERNLWDDMREGALFFKFLMDADIPHIAIENPIQHKYAREIIGREYDQIIQPHQFGHPESKATCLWLKNLPKLVPTNVLDKPERGYWDNQTPSGQNKLSPSDDRWLKRARTYPNIAKAMADQWVAYLLGGAKK